MFISSHLISGSRIGDVPFVTRSVPMSRLRQVTLLVTEGHSSIQVTLLVTEGHSSIQVTLFVTEGTSPKCMNAQHYID